MRSMTLAAAATLLLPATAFAQEPRTETYLLQVAAAVAGYSGGAPVWIVICETNGTYDVIGGYSSAAEAQQAVQANAGPQKRCASEGPYIAGPAPQTTAIRMPYGGGCKKGPDSDCVADSTNILDLGNIESVTLSYRLRNGQTINETFNPRRVEAIFFTPAAVDRMLVPYFVRVYGINGALRRRERVMSIFRVRDLRGP